MDEAVNKTLKAHRKAISEGVSTSGTARGDLDLPAALAWPFNRKR